MLAFEIDDIDPIAGNGWSILASGYAEHMTNRTKSEGSPSSFRFLGLQRNEPI